MENLINQLDGYDKLNPRQQEIISKVLQGESNKDIAAKLCISEKSFEKELTKIYALLNFDKSRKEKRTLLFVRLLELCGCKF